MRIVLTAHQFLPEYSTGTEIITLGVARELIRRGHTVTVFTGFPAKVMLPDEERFDRYTYEGIPVERFLHAHVPMGGQDNIVQAEYDNQLFYRAFKKFLQQYNPDLVHFFHLGRLSASAIDACCELHIPTCFTATDFWLICPTNQLRLPDNTLCCGPDRVASNCVRHMAEITQPPAIQDKIRRTPAWLFRLAVWSIQKNWVTKPAGYTNWIKALANRRPHLLDRMNKLDRVLAPSHIMLDMLKRNGMNPDRLIYLPYGIDLRHLPRITRRGQEPTLRIGFIGTLYEHKGCHVVIQAIRSLPADLPIELVVYGKLEEFPAYTEKLRNLAGDDPRIQFKGSFVNGQIGNILSTLDLIVCASIWYENTPLVIYEAMAAGCPVIASDLGGMSESVNNGVNGLLFPAGDSAALAERVSRLAKDRALLQKYAEATTPPSSVPDHVCRLEKIYAELVQPAKAVAPAA